MTDRKTINVHGVNCIDFNYTYANGTFVLEIYADKHIIKIHCERWLLKVLAQTLWNILKKEKHEIAEAEEILRTGE